MGPTEEQITLNYALARMYAQAGMVEPAIHYLRLAFMDGFNDNKKLMQDTGFATLRKTQQFRLLLTEEHIATPDKVEQSSIAHGKNPLRVHSPKNKSPTNVRGAFLLLCLAQASTVRPATSNFSWLFSGSASTRT